MNRRATGREPVVAGTGPVPPGLAVQHVGKWSAASQLLSRIAAERLCGMDLPNQARLAQLDLSQVIVATYHDETVGFAAYKPGAVGVRVAHELWVDANAACGLAPVAVLLLGQLEQEALKSGCSKLFIVVPQATPLRPILQTYGYAMTLEGADLLWFEKAFRSEQDRAACGR